MWSLCGVRTECVVALASMQFVRLLTLDSDALHTGSNGSSEQSLTSLSLCVFLARASFVFISLAICSLLITHSGRAVEFTSRCNDRRFRRNEIAVVRLSERAKPYPWRGAIFTCVSLSFEVLTPTRSRVRVSRWVGSLRRVQASSLTHSFVNRYAFVRVVASICHPATT